MLTDDQDKCLQLALQGHNFAVLGQAGTGKTHLANEVRVHLMGAGKKVAVTTSTGIAGRQYNFHTKTLHSWSGVKTGQLHGTQLLESLNHRVRSNILSCDVLMFDEISMISQKMLEQQRRSMYENSPGQMIAHQALDLQWT